MDIYVAIAAFTAGALFGAFTMMRIAIDLIFSRIDQKLEEAIRACNNLDRMLAEFISRLPDRKEPE